MPEPHSTVLAGAAAASIPASTLVLFGAQADALALGLFAAIFVSIWTQTIDNKRKAFAAVMLSAMLAGYGSPAAAQYVVSSWPSWGVQAETARLLFAVLIGLASPSLVPLLLRTANSKIGGAA